MSGSCGAAVSGNGKAALLGSRNLSVVPRGSLKRAHSTQQGGLRWAGCGVTLRHPGENRRGKEGPQAPEQRVSYSPWRDQGGAGYLLAAHGQDHSGAGGCVLKEIEPVEKLWRICSPWRFHAGGSITWRTAACAEAPGDARKSVRRKEHQRDES